MRVLSRLAAQESLTESFAASNYCFFQSPRLKRKNNMASDWGTKDYAKAFKKRWSVERIFAPIDLNKTRPCFWDVSSKDFHNRYVTAKK